MYDHTRQYRCDIIRGKSQRAIDDLLPAYAKVINDICPCTVEDFKNRFNTEIQRFLPEKDREEKTLNNHRTEISGKLFGMYYKSDDGMVYTSQRTLKFLEDNDQPAFFKDACYKMQFPNGMQKSNRLQERIDKHISIRPNSFVLKVLQIASQAGISLTVREIGYYVLNSLDVLQGKADPVEVINQIVNDKKAGIERKVEIYDDAGNAKASSYAMQHIREQLNYLELANLIRIYDGTVSLNDKESETIEIFARDYNKAPEFNVYAYDISDTTGRKKLQYDWDYYFSTVSSNVDKFETDIYALLTTPLANKTTDVSPDKSSISIPANNDGGQKRPVSMVEFGDAGESLVYEYEKQRVAKYNKRLVNKVIAFGKTKGIGFDIQSIVAERGETAEFCKYIEVKSTKRLTSPDPNNSLWMDTLNITRNEWVAAQQHQGYYSIYRVYFTKDGISMFILNNISGKNENNKISVTPVNYRLDFSNDSIDKAVDFNDPEYDGLRSLVNELSGITR